MTTLVVCDDGIKWIIAQSHRLTAVYKKSARGVVQKQEE